MDERHRCVVRWQHGTYRGEVEVFVGPDDDADLVIAKAKERWRRQFGPPLAMAYESFAIVKREVADG